MDGVRGPGDRAPAQVKRSGQGRRSVFRSNVLILAAAMTAAGFLGRAAAEVEQAPVPQWSLIAGLILIGIGVALTVRRVTAAVCAGVLGGVWLGGAIGAASGGAVLVAAWGAIGASLLALAAAGIGALLRLMVTRGGRLSPRAPWVGASCIAVTLLPLPYALIARGLTVHADHPHRGFIDVAVPSFDGVALGAGAATVRQHLGSVPLTTGNQDFAPTRADSKPLDGPSSLSYGPPDDSSLRYQYVSVGLHHGRVSFIQIDDQQAATAEGLGPGDSLALVRRVYPRAGCAKDSISSEGGPPTPLPYCELRLGPRRWLTFFGTYQRAGAPITAVWLSTFRLE